MNATAPPLELHALEKLREEELEEARAIQSVMLPAESLRAGAAANYETLTLRLLAGDAVLFCTDGISDAFNRKEEQFGFERLQEICDAQQFASPSELLARVFTAVENFSRRREQQDDMAAALFHFCS